MSKDTKFDWDGLLSESLEAADKITTSVSSQRRAKRQANYLLQTNKYLEEQAQRAWAISKASEESAVLKTEKLKAEIQKSKALAARLKAQNQGVKGNRKSSKWIWLSVAGGFIIITVTGLLIVLSSK